MRVLGITASPRRGGNSETLLDTVLEGAACRGGQGEKVALSDLKIAPCRNCEGCATTGVCTTHDDMDRLYEAFRTLDALVLASPIFFRGVSAQAKVFIDRCQALWVAKYRLKQPLAPARRRGLFIATAGGPSPKEFEGAIVVVRSFFATIDVSYDLQLLVSGIEKAGDIRKRPEVLAEAAALGEKLVAR